MKATSNGNMDKNVPSITAPHGEFATDWTERNAKVSTYLSVDEIMINGPKKLFHSPIKITIASVAKAGLIKGKTIDQ